MLTPIDLKLVSIAIIIFLLPNDFAHRIVKHVGNYGEVYDRNIGQPFGLKRGLNALWTDGGLMYAPPFR